MYKKEDTKHVSPLPTPWGNDVKIEFLHNSKYILLNNEMGIDTVPTTYEFE